MFCVPCVCISPVVKATLTQAGRDAEVSVLDCRCCDGRSQTADGRATEACLTPEDLHKVKTVMSVPLVRLTWPLDINKTLENPSVGINSEG